MCTIFILRKIYNRATARHSYTVALKFLLTFTNSVYNYNKFALIITVIIIIKK